MSPSNLHDLIQESAQWLRDREVGKIDFGIILGSGLGSVSAQFELINSFQYGDIPHLAGTAVMSHNGVLHYVSCGDKTGLIFTGRIHYYEGYELWQVAYPVRILRALGASILITTGAAGGLNPDYSEGDIVVLKDHINLMPENPLRGLHDERLGERFPDMSAVYAPEPRVHLVSAGSKLGLRVHQGVYAALPGPSLETKAEYSYLHEIGADLVAMSVVPEVIVGVQSEMSVVGVCIVSNVCYPPERVSETTIEQVVRTVMTKANDVGVLISGLLMSDPPIVEKEPK